MTKVLPIRMEMQFRRERKKNFWKRREPCIMNFPKRQENSLILWWNTVCLIWKEGRENSRVATVTLWKNIRHRSFLQTLMEPMQMSMSLPTKQDMPLKHTQRHAIFRYYRRHTVPQRSMRSIQWRWNISHCRGCICSSEKMQKNRKKHTCGIRWKQCHTWHA